MIDKESHRISMCVDLFVPLTRALPVATHVGPALSVASVRERHLGRWLVLAEVAVRAGDMTPLEEARTRAADGASSSRAAWALVAWALDQSDAMARNTTLPPNPTTRPTLELIARLSDRPSADRDTTFLFRMARAGATSAKPMLDTLARSSPLADEPNLRAALYLARDHGRAELREALVEAATTGKREELRGMAAAALWDASPPSAGEASVKMRSLVRDICDELIQSRVVGNVAWGASSSAPRPKHHQVRIACLTETPFRWILWGWLE